MLLYVSTSGMSDWWGSLTSKQQTGYLEQHPKSKYGRRAVAADLKSDVSENVAKLKPSVIKSAAKALRAGIFNADMAKTTIGVGGARAANSALGAAVGAAPGVLLAVVGVAAIAAVGAKETVHVYKQERQSTSASDSDVKVVEGFLHKIVDYIAAGKITKDPAKQLAQVLNTK